MNKNYDYKRLTPFKWFVLQNFPFIDEDFDAITNYQLFCKLGEEINKIIDSENLLGTEVENLSDYFNTLDVQDEINNKLEEMAQDGTLQEIITEYLQIKGILAFNTLNEMKNSTNLVNGSFVKTYGYYSTNDKGGAFYKIRNISNQDIIDNCSIIALNNENLVAELIIDGLPINVRQFGITGDGTTDDSNNFQKLINYLKNKGRNTILLNNNDNYFLNEGLILPYYINFACNGLATFTYNGSDYALTITRGNREYHDTITGQGNDINKLMEYGNIVITYVDTIVSTSNFIAGGIKVVASDEDGNIILHDYDINNCAFMYLTIGVYLKAIHLFATGINNCKFNYCNIACFYGVESEETFTDSGERMYMNNNFIYNCGIALLFKNATPSVYAINNCSFDNTGCVLYHTNTLENVVFDKCHFENIGNLSSNDIITYLNTNYPNAYKHIVYNAFNSIYQAGIITIMNSLLHFTSMNIDKFAFDGIYSNKFSQNADYNRRRLVNLNLKDNFFDNPQHGLTFTIANINIYFPYPTNNSSYFSYFAYGINYDDVFHFSEDTISSTSSYFTQRGITFSLNSDYEVFNAENAPFGITKMINTWARGNLRTFHKKGKFVGKGINAYVIIKIDNPSNITQNNFNVTFTDEYGLTKTFYLDTTKRINLGNNYYMYCATIDAQANTLQEVDILFNLYTNVSVAYLCGFGFIPYN